MRKRPEKTTEGRKLGNQTTGSQNNNFCRVQYYSQLFCSFQPIKVSGRHLQVDAKKKVSPHRQSTNYHNVSTTNCRKRCLLTTTKSLHSNNFCGQIVFSIFGPIAVMLVHFADFTTFCCPRTKIAFPLFVIYDDHMAVTIHR